MLTHLKQPNHWSCLPTSFAMILNITLDYALSIIGHDGSKIVADLPEPLCRQGFHIQEMVDLCWYHGITLTHIERQPVSSRRHPITGEIIDVNIMDGDPRFMQYLYRSKGVLGGIGKRGTPHAVAWFNGKMYDPNGFVHNDVKNQFFHPNELWIVLDK